MKKKLFVLFIIFLSIIPLNAQQIKGITGDTNWFANCTNFKPATTDYNEPNQILAGKISTDLKLTRNNNLIMNSIY